MRKYATIGEAFAFFRWTSESERDMDKAFGTGWPWSHCLNDTYLWRWESFKHG